MPGRGGHAVSGGWATLGNGSSVPSSLSLSTRLGNDPAVYTATETIEFIQGFESSASDSFEAYLSDGSDNGGGGNGGSGDGSDGTVAQNTYRYGFNGKENDNEVKGEGNQQDYGMRIYDPRLGRFLSVDPLTPKYPWLTPYQFCSNTPIASTDLDGLESNKNFNFNDRWFQNYFKGLAENLLGEKFNVPLYSQPRSTIADPFGAIKSNPILQRMQHLYEMMQVNAGIKDIKETEYYQASVEFSKKLANFDGEALGEVTGQAVQLYFIFKGGSAYVDALEVEGSQGQLTKDWNAGIRQFHVEDDVSVKTKTNTTVVEANSSNTNAAESNTSSSSQVPQRAINSANYAEKYNGAAQPGYKGGRNYLNDGRGGGQILPQQNSDGSPITYKEYDVLPFKKGVNRGAERVVVGSDKKAYYTNDHYKTFTEITNPQYKK